MLIELQGLRKRYNLGQPNEAEVLHGIDLRVQRGEFLALMGPSGSGKSTLLNILGLLERMTEGDYRLLGDSVRGLPDAELTLRRRGTAFIVVTHDPRLAARCDRLVELVDGRIARDEPVAQLSPVAPPR